MTIDHPLAQVFERIAADTVAREADHRIDHAAIDALRAAGYTRLRVPEEYGGAGLTLAEFYPFVVELGAADPNLVQALRAHLLFVEQVLTRPADDFRDRWLRRLGEGAIVGNAITEKNNATGQTTTRVLRSDGRLVLNGTKFYSTGTLYADWIMVVAVDEHGDEHWIQVPARADGVELHDDWDGFGQRLSASGTTVFHGVEVDPAEVIRAPYSDNPSAFHALAQSVHLANLAGIAQAVVRDATAYVRTRTRAYSHGAADLPADDPQVQQVLGEIAATAYASRTLVAGLVGELEVVLARVADGTATDADFTTIDLHAYQAQLAIAPRVLEAATTMFEVGGASATSRARGFDRHWRNARVLAQHNPMIYRARLIGAHLLHGDHRAVQYTVGSTPTPSSPDTLDLETR